MQSENRPDAEKLRDLIKGIKFAMLTTLSEDNQLHSRPMTLQETEFDGDLWFIIKRTTAPANEIEDNRQVNLAFSDVKNFKFISVAGEGSIFQDRQKAEELWNPFYKTWFPEGLEDPNLAVLKVTVKSADVWDTPSSKVVRLVGFVKGALTGKHPSELGHRDHLQLN